MRASSDHAALPLILRVPGKFLRAVATVMFVDPFALMVAAAGGWLMLISLRSLGHLVAAGMGAEFCNVVSCALYAAVLSAVTVLALAHILITGLAGWGVSVPAGSARGASVDRPGPGRGS